MKEYKYGITARFIYRHANLFLTPVLFIYTLFSVAGMIRDWKFLLPLLMNLILFFVLTKFYLNVYKRFPFLIKADNEKLICSDFLKRDKVIELHHSNITKIEGGIFSGNTLRPIYVIDEKNDVKIGINSHIKNYNKLLTTILGNVSKEVYAEALKNVETQGIVVNNNLNKKKNKKARKRGLK